jgi:hypothetical protein
MNFSSNFYSNYTEPEQGYGMPSKGTYSLDLGGFKTFGTEGQGNSSFGLKDDFSYTCSERIVMLIIVARTDTYMDPFHNDYSDYDYYNGSTIHPNSSYECDTTSTSTCHNTFVEYNPYSNQNYTWHYIHNDSNGDSYYYDDSYNWNDTTYYD